MTRLNFDFARCLGVGFVNDEDPRIIDWRDGCEDCLRRTSPGHPTHQNMMAPPEIIAFECEYYILPEDYK